MLSYFPKSNDQAERYVESFKKVTRDNIKLVNNNRSNLQLPPRKYVDLTSDDNYVLLGVFISTPIVRS